MWRILADQTRHKYCMYLSLERVTLIISSYFAFNVMYLFQVCLLSFIKYAQPTQPRVSVEISIF